MMEVDQVEDSPTLLDDGLASLRSSSTKLRLEVLQNIHHSLVKATDDDTLKRTLPHLLSTYPRYQDSESRKAVRECLCAALRNPCFGTSGLDATVKFLSKECEKAVVAPTNTLVLLEWCALLLHEISRDGFVAESFDKLGSISLAAAAALEKCLQPGVRHGLQQAAHAVARRGLRDVFTSDQLGENTLKSLLAVLTSGVHASQRNAPYLGEIAAVCSRIDDRREQLRRSVTVILSFYAKCVIGSKQIISGHIAIGMHDFFANFVGLDEFSQVLVPVLEKAILRSPEIVLQGIVPAAVNGFPEGIDLSQPLSGSLLQPLLAAFKSANSSIRDGAGIALESLLHHCRQDTALMKISEEIINSLKAAKSTNADQRILLASILDSIAGGRDQSTAIVTSLSPIAAKETNETVLKTEVVAISRHMGYLTSHGFSVEQPMFDIFLKGCIDKRPLFRKTWLLAAGSILLRRGGQLESEARFESFALEVTKILAEAFEEISLNPTPAVQNNTVAIAFVAVCLASSQLPSRPELAALDIPKVIREAMVTSPKISFLLNSRVYCRLTSTEDLRWWLRALISLSSSLDAGGENAQVAWAQAILYLISSPEVTAEVRKETGLSLSAAYLDIPQGIGSSILLGVWEWLRAFVQQEKDSLAITSKAKISDLNRAIRHISPPKRIWEEHKKEFPKQTVIGQAVSMVVACRPELIHGVEWIKICLRMGVDPGKIAVQRSHQLLGQVVNIFQPRPLFPTDLLELAAANASATLAFVAPDVIISLLIKQFKADLDVSQLVNLGPADSAIARAPEGVAFVDILDQQSKHVFEDKNRKDYDLLKWDEEMRSKVAQKKGQQKKLTPDQQSKVDAQIKLESAIRKKVWEAARNLRRGTAMIKSLANGPPTDARLWLPSAADALLDAINAGSALFIEEECTEAYLACSAQVNPRLGSLRKSIGIATLRATGRALLTSGLEEEPLGELTTRVLYRLRFAAEQRPFDPASLSYMLPLIFLVLDQGAVGYPRGEEADAQILLALEFLSYHTETCADSCLPRRDVIAHIVLSMQRYPQHYRLLKDTLLEFCRSISDNITLEERQTLLETITVPQSSIRAAVVQAIQAEIDLSDLPFSEQVWFACHDEDEETSEFALAIWEESEMKVQPALANRLLQFIISLDRPTRVIASKALAQAIDAAPEAFRDVVSTLEATYVKEAQPLVLKRNKFGMIEKGDLTDHWEARSGVAIALREMSAFFPQTSVVPFIDFLISRGPLSDRNLEARSEMVEAGIALMEERGKQSLEELMSLFERTLDLPDAGTQEADWINEAVIVLYGSLAQHLPLGDARVEGVVKKLITTLSTPSEPVQFAVAGCLCPLIRLLEKEAGSYVGQLLEQLLDDKQYANQRGAAYGLAGLVNGLGLSALQQFRVMSALRSATEDKKSSSHRQGALLAYELLSQILGQIFEPYVIEILPQLLACFGDPNSSVREACLDASKTCFRSLSPFGVLQVLPRLLEGLNETQWRTKKGACELLGAMAYLGPQQLASNLPDIIPPLTAVLTDSHKEVRIAANNSLQRFGEVISNPEVKGQVGILLKALSDPTKYTEDALDGLIKVSFVHYLDAPSLALVVRILERGLSDRSSTKRKAAQIIGSLAHLTEKNDLVSHLPILVSGLRLAIVDPVPATRATASKALGSLVEKLGEDALPDLIPNLMSSLRTDTGAGDRLGSAQALSEVLAGLGTGRLEETLPTILQNVASIKATVREGFMTLFIFLPACFGSSFAMYLNQIIPSILGGLADDLESIRDISLRAGRLLVKNFATKAIDLLLPELQRGLADDSHRIRLSSVELVGDLLFNLTGISNKPEADEEEESVAQAGQSLLEVLGEERRNKVLSSLYICRCDTSGMVRTAAIAVWKALVATPRTLRELVPTLTQMIITRLASNNMEQKVIAGNALGEVIRKAGDGVLAALLPSLEEGLQTSVDPDNRQGICIALREVVNAATPESLEDNEKKLIAIVRIALVDSNADVREAAAESFDALQQTFGKRAVDQVLPHLLSLLRIEGDAENALSALLTLLTEATRANVILPNLIPTLLTNPISSFNAKALASLAKVGGSSMTRRLPIILNSLAENIVLAKDAELRVELELAFDSLLSSIDEFDGLNTAMSVMLALIKSDDHRKRAVAASRLAVFFATPTVDYSRYNQDLIRVLLISFDDRDKEVVQAAWTALSQLQSHLRKEEMESLVPSTRQVLQQVGVAGSNLPGFALPKGILPVLQIFLQGLMNGTVDQRVQAALGISDILDRSGADGLKPFVTQITGPLIRVVGERSLDVKCAILYTLNQLLEKVPTFLRPFLPQLQRTFTKSIADPSSDVLRNRANQALSTLITLMPRIDPLVAELVTGAKTSDAGVRNAMLKGLQEVVSRAGSNMSETSREAILGLIDSQNNAQDDNMTTTNSKLLGAMIKVLPSAAGANLVKSRIICHPQTNASVLALNATLIESPQALTKEFLDEIVTTISQGISHRSPFIQQNCIVAAGKLLLSPDNTQHSSVSEPLFIALAPAIQPGSDIDTRRLALVVIRTVSRHYPQAVRPFLDKLISPTFASVRDPVIPVKLAAEAAFIQLLDVVESESTVFDEFMAAHGKELPTGMQRSMSDYFKRVALRLGAQARERREAEGGQGGLGLSSDEVEDEREVWSVGRLEVVGQNGFSQD